MNKYNYLLLSFFIILSIVTTQSVIAQNSNSRYTYQSVLNEGKWVKIRIKNTGIYKLSYDDIKKMGFEDPSKVKIYGYGGGKLEESFSKSYIDDLPEVPVWANSINGFKSGDYLLFYGVGTTKWTYEKNRFNHENNPYDVYGHYFLTQSNEPPKTIKEVPEYLGSSQEITAFDDYLVHERDSVAILNSGRELFGENFNTNKSRNFDFSVPGITNDKGSVFLSFAGAPSENAKINLSIDGNLILQTNIGPVSSGDYYTKANLAESAGSWSEDKKENFRINVSYTAKRGIAHLNFISLNFKRKLKFYNQAYTFFRHTDSRTKALNYVIDNATANCQIWNVSDPLDVKKISTSLQGNQISFSAEPGKGNIEEYVMIDMIKSFPTPEVVGIIENQNLHASPQVDMVIIAPKAYVPFAEQLKEKHKEKQGLEVIVVQPEWIYNEFSSGNRDATAYRRFMKMFYDRANLEGKNPAPKYLLLYGDGFFDNRHLTSAGKLRNPNNFLLTYQPKSSLSEHKSFGTDDYFGFLDDNSGIKLDEDKLNLAIGRFPVSSEEQARNAMEKVISYMEGKNYGKWRNSVIFTSDDTGNDTYFLHTEQAESLANIVENNRPNFIVTKNYMDAYEPVDINGKKTYPDAKNKLLNTLKEGCLLMHYTGHGSANALSGEDMMNIADIRQMSFENLPIWIIAACDFAWFDGEATSAAEEIFLNKKSSGIAVYAASRVVGSYPNFYLNEKIINALFPTNENNYPTLGEAFRIAKNTLGTDSNKLNFVLLGDPALKLNYPENKKVVLENILINGKSVDIKTKLNFRALDEVKIIGYIAQNGEKIEDFNGKIYVTAFDGKQITKINIDDRTFPFGTYQNKIYTGNNEVKNGQFSFSFKIPLDISYNDSNTGKINFYAWDENVGGDATGGFFNYTLSGSNDDINKTDEGPTIREMYLNSSLFQNGGTVHETPLFYAEVSDEDGINTTGTGIGHDITICIDKNPGWTYNLNSFYQPIDAISGSVRFSIPELPAGEHQLVFKVWDILNNSTTNTLNFKVDKRSKPEIYNIKVQPNPAREKATFIIEHNRPETFMEIEMKVFDLTGRVIWTDVVSGENIPPIDWDLQNNMGAKIQPGTYLYQAVIKSNGGKEATKTKKIIVAKQ